MPEPDEYNKEENSQQTSPTPQPAPTPQPVPQPTPTQDFAEAIGFITDLLRDVINENRQLSVDVSELRMQLRNMRENLTRLNDVMYQSSSGQPPIAVRLETLERTAQQIEESLSRDTQRCIEQVERLQQQLDRHLDQVQEQQRREEDRQQQKKLVDRAAWWKIATAILAALLGILSTWVFIDSNSPSENQVSEKRLEQLISEHEALHAPVNQTNQVNNTP